MVVVGFLSYREWYVYVRDGEMFILEIYRE